MQRRENDFEEELTFIDERLRLAEEAKALERRRTRRLRRLEEIRFGGLALAPWAVVLSTLVGAKLFS